MSTTQPVDHPIGSPGRPFDPRKDLDAAALASWELLDESEKWNPYRLNQLAAYARWYESHVLPFNPSPSWEDFENFASQAMGRPGVDIDKAIGLLLRWAAERPEVQRALDVFLHEALRAHLSTCAGCGKPLVTHPAPDARMYHDDACRKRAARSK